MNVAWVMNRKELIETHNQWLIAMKGHPATGKSTLARALAQKLGWPLIDKDDIKDHTLHLPGGNELAYAILWQVAATQLALGLSVVVDSPLSYPLGYTTACRLASENGARLCVLETRLEEAEWRRRLETRSPAESAHKICGWAAMQAQLQTYASCWKYSIDPRHHLIVETDQPLPTLLEAIHIGLFAGESHGQQSK
jgi:predicted kinase